MSVQNMKKTKKQKHAEQRQKAALKKISLHKLGWLEYVTLGIAAWFYFYPEPYEILFVVLLCIPILGLVLNGINGKPSIATLVRISAGENYDVADFLNVPALIILVRVMRDFQFESFVSMIVPGTAAFILMVAVLFATHKLTRIAEKHKLWIYLSVIFNVGLYSYAVSYGVNCVFDYSDPVTYNVKVVSEYGSRGLYYIRVTDWKNNNETQRVYLTSEQYQKIQVGGNVQIDVKPGLFGMAWYYME